MTQARLSLGRQGEELAARFLEGRGCTVIARNYRTPLGELDLVARDGRYLLFVEVKARRGTTFGLPAEAVGSRKQRQILRAAQCYLGSRGDSGLQPRFDVISVLFGPGEPLITHLPDAFGL